MAELAEPHPMQRLLQGEVGSGKTLVALRAMLAVVDAGGQAALLAPTEVLATQHFQTITGCWATWPQGGTARRRRARHRRRAAHRLDARGAEAGGDAAGRVGRGRASSSAPTPCSAPASQFADLGLVVVDEQHRFGVEQRAALSAKAAARPHVLVMTATPIPRSVAMTVFGDLETSTLREIPAGRADVSTVVVDAARSPAWVDRAWQRIVEEVGRRAAGVRGLRPDHRRPRPAARRGDDRTTSERQPPAIAVEDLYAELAAGPLAGAPGRAAARPAARPRRRTP